MRELTLQELEMEFIKFLKKHNAYKQYMTARRQYLQKELGATAFQLVNPNMLVTRDFDRLHSHVHESIIDHSFCWRQTKEGHDFWSELNDKWYDIASNMKIIKNQ